MLHGLTTALRSLVVSNPTGEVMSGKVCEHLLTFCILKCITDGRIHFQICTYMSKGPERKNNYYELQYICNNC